MTRQADDPHPALVEPATVRLAAWGVAFALLLGALMVIPVPYAVQSPGPTVNVLGTQGSDVPVITVEGAPTYPTGDGQLRLTTVNVAGGPGNPVSLMTAAQGWLSGEDLVVPREEMFGDEDADQISEFQRAQMEASQSNAAAAALQELGYEVPMRLVVAEAMADMPAEGILLPDDVITAITLPDGSRTDFADFRDLSDLMLQIPPGTQITVEVERGGEVTSVSIPTSARPEGDDRPGSVLGVYVSADVTLPVDVSFDLNNIGGPSAGTMFAIGVVDLMTPGEMTGGVEIAGTGTMSVDGYVGAIGGIRQKMAGAAGDGATWFLAPASNCDEVVGYEPAGLQVVAVTELADAVGAVEAIAAGATDDLPRCEAAVDPDPAPATTPATSTH